MRYLTCFTPDRHRIDITNSWLGEEKIYYDGDLVSRHYSIFGSLHVFSVQEHKENIRYEIHVSLRWPFRIGFDIFRDGKALLLS